MSKAYLVLANGRSFEGERFGAVSSKPAVGELVFNTGVVGYIELLTDPRCCGQIIMQTFPLGGNYGWIDEDECGKCYASAFIVREWSDTPSNFRMQGTLDDYLKRSGIPGLCGIDTREVTQIIREEGSMAACIVDDPADAEAALKSFSLSGAVEKVSGGKSEQLTADNAKYNVALIDFGAAGSLSSALLAKGCNVTVLPYNTSADEILAAKPDGVVLSGGPGNPNEYTAAVDTAKNVLGKLPVLGVGFGHQLLALAAGGKVTKLTYGHHGANQPVRDTRVGHILITTQNHGYAVEAESLGGRGEAVLVNVNDGTCEGICYPNDRALSVQFSPESCSDPRGGSNAIDEFIALMGGNN